MFGVGGQKTAVCRGRVSLTLAPRAGGQALQVSALVLPRLTVYAGELDADVRSWPHLQDLNLADPGYSSAEPIEILLGADVYSIILQAGLRKGGTRAPIAQSTSLGWILSGAIGDTAGEQSAHTHRCHIEEDLSSVVRRFWEQEEVLTTAPALSREEKECEEHFVRTHSRSPEGRYSVRLPVVSPLPDLSATRGTAARALKQMESRFSRDQSLRSMYCDFMGQYAELNHMTAVAPAPTSGPRPSCYLSHHGVMREASTTTKLRVVFNGSSKVPSGETFNLHLMTGPNLLPALSDILLRWRRHRFVLATDMEKMYRQIEVHPEDRDLQRILWRDHDKEEVREYQLNTVTYGLACAPFLAIRTLRQLADDAGKEWPLGAAALRQDTYMDDVLTGSSSILKAMAVQRQLIQICKAGGFPLRKWSANDAALLEDVDPEDRLLREPRWWLPGESHSTLGLQWHPEEDSFSFSTKLVRVETFSKRAVLSLSAKLFDPLGWLSPISIRAKILFQATWLLRLDWDEPLPDADAKQWKEFQADLPSLEQIRVPRWLTGDARHGRCEIHGFADASERAYAAVVYLRTCNEKGQVEVRLVAAKTKVAPLKQVTLPRLELCAATLLTRLVAHLLLVLELSVPTHLWSDSTVALSWIQAHTATWKTYVANRVSEIQTTLPEARWHYVPGKDNPADCASRGLPPSELGSHHLWWSGPPWLQSGVGSWPSPTDVTHEPPERRLKCHAAVVVQEEEPEELTRHSSLSRLLRTTAWCRRRPSGKPAPPARGPVSRDSPRPNSRKLAYTGSGWYKLQITRSI